VGHSHIINDNVLSYKLEGRVKIIYKIKESYTLFKYNLDLTLTMIYIDNSSVKTKS